MSADASQPPHVRTLSQVLAGRLIGSDGTPSPAAEDSEPLRQPLGSSSSQLNRDRYRESQRLVATQMLVYSLPVLLFSCLLILGLAVTYVTIYIKGWLVWHNDREKPCDQPLKWWLLTTLLLPVTVNLVMQCQTNYQQESRANRFQVVFMPILIAVGTWLCLGCRTCQKTNPPLYQFVKMYLIYQTSVWVLMMFVLFGLVTLILWLHRHGLLDSGPGPAMAAKPGLIQELDTVPYSAALFSGQENGGEPAECCICQEDFQMGDRIKRTPCKHFFHEDCLGTWLEKYARICPLCRKDLEEAMEHGDNSMA